jgi:hypothetical protein
MAMEEPIEDVQDDVIEGFRLASMADALAFAETTNDMHKQMVIESAAREQHISKLKAQMEQRNEWWQGKLDWREAVLVDWYRREGFTHNQPLTDGVELTQRKVPEKDRILWPEKPEDVPEWGRASKVTVSIDKRGMVARLVFNEEGGAIDKETGEIVGSVAIDPSKPSVKYSVKYPEVRT